MYPECYVHHMLKQYIFVQVTSGLEYIQMLDLLDMQGYHWRSQTPMHDNNYWSTYERDGFVIFGIDPIMHEVWHDFRKHYISIDEYRAMIFNVSEEDNLTDLDSVL